MSIKDKYYVESIDSFLTHDWLMHKHYAKRIPMITHSFGLFNEKLLIGVLTIGKPASPSLCDGICGKELSKYVYELNRLCVNEGLEKNVLSFFVSSSLKLIKEDMILVSYADTSQNHHGYIYQATNWIYTGLSQKMNEWKIKNSNKHSRTIFQKYNSEQMKNNENFIYSERPRKHRYVMFLGANKKEFRKKLNYNVLPYPKGQNKRYDASYQPTIQSKLF